MTTKVKTQPILANPSYLSTHQKENLISYMCLHNPKLWNFFYESVVSYYTNSEIKETKDEIR